MNLLEVMKKDWTDDNMSTIMISHKDTSKIGHFSFFIYNLLHKSCSLQSDY